MKIKTIPKQEVDRVAAEQITVTVDGITAMEIVSQIQLAAQVPGNDGAGRRIAVKFARTLQRRVSKVSPLCGIALAIHWPNKSDTTG